MITGTRPVPVKRADRMIDDCYTTSRGHKVTQSDSQSDTKWGIGEVGPQSERFVNALAREHIGCFKIDDVAGSTCAYER